MAVRKDPVVLSSYGHRNTESDILSDVTPEPPEYDGPSRPHTSFSQTDMYRSCSLKYYFKYVLKQEQPPSLPLAKGKAGHAAIERNHRVKAKTNVKAMPRGELLALASDAFDAETYEVELTPGENIDKAKDDLMDALTIYHGETSPKIRPLAVELPFNLDLPATEDYEYPIKIVNGRIDLLDAAGVLDAKFANKRKSQPDVDESWQLTLYDMVIEQMTGHKVPNVGLMVFTPPGTGKVPAPADVQILMRSASEMEPEQRQRRRDRLTHVLRTTQRAIDAGIFMPTDDPRVCSWCDYRKTCKSSMAKNDFDAIAIRAKG